MSALLDSAPWQATHDEDGAIRAVIARQLARQVYRVRGAASRRGYVVEGHVAPPKDQVYIYEEWPDGDEPSRSPSLVIEDSEGIYSRGNMAPHLLESSRWPEGDGLLEYAVLRYSRQYDVPLAIFAHATDRAWRRALLRGAREALDGTLDCAPDRDDRDCVILPAGALFYDQLVRVTMTGSNRFDSADSAGQRHRAARLRVRASIPVVAPVVFPVVTETQFVGPQPGSDETARGWTLGPDQ